MGIMQNDTIVLFGESEEYLKTCTKCNIAYPNTKEFFHSTGNGYKIHKLSLILDDGDRQPVEVLDSLRYECKKCRESKRKENIDHVRQIERRYREANQDRIKERRKNYYQANKQRLNLYQAEYRKKKRSRERHKKLSDLLKWR